MECELHAPAETGGVDRRHRWVRERAHPCEELVSGAAALDRLLPGLDPGELVEVGPAREAPGLAREDEGPEVAVLQLGQQLGERFEDRTAQDVRASVAASVVHRHERDRAVRGVEPFESEHRLESRLLRP